MITAYTYFIKWTNTGMKYYGVRYARGCSPDDLFVTYFTSSKYVSEYIAIHGLPDIISVRQVFSDKDKAIAWEERVLQRMKVIYRDDYLNRHNGKAISLDCMGWQTGLTKDTHTGIARQAKLISAALNGRTKETHQYIADANEKKRGRTKDTHAGVASQAAKMSGRTKENDAGVAQMAASKIGRTKDTHAGIASQADKLASTWTIVGADGTVMTITNLNQWCKDNGFRRGSIYKNAKKDRAYKGLKFYQT